jgi:hypothetical protein
MVPVLRTVPLIVPQPFDILAAVALLAGFNFARRVTGNLKTARASYLSKPRSLKAALAREIMGANEIGVKRAKARPRLRSQFRIGRRRTPVARRAMWRNNRLRPGHGGANEARARVGRPH